MRALVAGAAALALCACPSLAAAQGPPPDSQFQKVTIDATPGEPIDLAVLPDARVLHTERSGEVWLHNPANGLKTLAAKLNVYSHDEEGLQSIALDPGFASNRWVYLYYSPPLDTPVDDPATPTVNEGDAPGFGTPADFAKFKGYIQLSRFKWGGSTIDLGSEQKILQVPVDRGICCHVGGDIVFDQAGNLLLSTGDDSNPFESDGYAPIDERPGRNPVFDAQRSAANTNDLRGKVLRITVGRRRRLHDPRRQPVRRPEPADEARDLPHGPAQPVPDRVQQGERGALRRRLLAGRQRSRTRCAGRRARASGRWPRSPATTAGRTARRPSCRTSTTTSPPASRAPRSTAPRRSTSRRTTPASRTCRR